MLDLTTPSWRKVGGGNWGCFVKGQRESWVSGFWAPWVIVHKEMGFVHAPILAVNSLAPGTPLSANTALKGTSRIRDGWFPLFSGFPGGSVVKNLPAMQETQGTWIWSPGWEDPLEEGMATPLVFLPGECCGQRSLAGYIPWGYKESAMCNWGCTLWHNSRAAIIIRDKWSRRQYAGKARRETGNHSSNAS